MISIRSETPDDHDAIRRVIVDAFTDCEFGYNGEADLVDQLRNECDDLLALVATDGDTIVGHILFSPVSVRIDNSMVQGMGLAPMAVQPNCQLRWHRNCPCRIGAKTAHRKRMFVRRGVGPSQLLS